MNDLQAAHARSIQLTIDAAHLTKPGQLAWPTPCSDWNLAELLDHMTVQNIGFAAAAAGNGGDESLWVTGAHRDDPIADYVASATAVTARFAEPGVADRLFTLPELSREQPFTGSQAITMHMVDSVVHAWDVARSTGHDIDPDPDLLEQTLRIAEQVPDDEDRRQPGAHFGPRVTMPHDASPLDRMLALFGRDPEWSPPQLPR